MGWLSDRIEGKWLLIFCNFLMVVTMAIIWQSRDVTVLAAASLVFGFAYGAAYTLVPLMVGSYYGAANFPKIIGFMIPSNRSRRPRPRHRGVHPPDYKSYDSFFIGLLILLVVSV